jgi:hypothetical protein
MCSRDEHPAARGFARWAIANGYEWDAPDVDGGRSLGSLWHAYSTSAAVRVGEPAPIADFLPRLATGVA